ncbi:hypothetical protein VXE44_18985, partial [Acinetobacter nosocomialis]
MLFYKNILTLSILAAISIPVFAAENESLNYNVVNVQAEASRQVSNDEMHATLYIEK